MGGFFLFVAAFFAATESGRHFIVVRSRNNPETRAGYLRDARTIRASNQAHRDDPVFRVAVAGTTR